MLWLVPVLLFFPALALYSQRWLARVHVLSPIVLCYLLGIVLGNVPGVEAKAIAQPASEGAVLLSLPLLLFSTDVVRWLKVAPRAAFGFALAVLGAMVSSAVACKLLAHVHPETDKIAGMLVGVYTGGTPNMSAIGLALGVDDETFVLVNAADIALSAVYLLLLLTVARPLLAKILPDERPAEDDGAAGADAPKTDVRVSHVLVAAALAAGCAGVSVGASQLLFGELKVAPIILGVTTLALALSFVPRVRALAGSYEAGEYLLLIFAVSIGTLARLEELLAALSGVFTLVAVMLAGAIVLHYALCAVLRVDVDTAIITSVAAVFGPAFVGPVATAIGNRGVLVSGIATGVIGYAVGNYAGLLLSWLLGGA
jgi:uncharacterized membrane protein